MTKDISPYSVAPELLGQKILFIRGHKVMLDNDLAELYGVSTKVLNQAVKRNTQRFPSDFMFQLNLAEVKTLNRSQIVTGSQKHRDPRFQPYAFTEHGVAMLSSVLKSERAAQVNIFIVRTFIKLRKILSSNGELAYKIQELERDQKNQNRHINKIYSLIDALLRGPAKQSNPIGFEPK
ncbi:MAG: ORF6N domain-containing protein [Patescibacteria group bacterium]